MPDQSRDIIERIESARNDGEALAIVGGNSKPFAGRSVNGAPLNVAEHSGILSYSPNELVLTARGGTTLAEIEHALEEHGQMLGPEPPRFADSATIGGTLACNYSGPRRPWSGSIRDAVLGVRLITGRAEQLRFGGQVMKNVAGFDVSRLQSGALGAFGVITEVSLKLLPKPASSITRVQEIAAADAIVKMNELAGRPHPVSGAAWVAGKLYLRLAGAASAVESNARHWGGQPLDDDREFWRDLKEQRLAFFDKPQPLWRFSVKSTAELPDIDAEWLVDWGGAQRFVHGDFRLDALEPLAAAAGGHVSLFSGGERTGEVFQRLSTPIVNLHLRLKRSFDPDAVLNPGRLYSWL